MIYDIETVPRKDATKVEERTKTIVREIKKAAQFLDIKSDEDLGHAVILFMQAKATREVIQDLTEPFRKIAYGHYKQTQETQKSLIEPLDEAVEILRDRVNAYYRNSEDKLIATVKEKGEDVRLEDVEPLESAMREVTDRFHLRKYHKATVVDMEAFLRHVLETGSYELVSPNYTALNGIARRMGENIGVEGVVVHVSTTPVVKNV